MIAFLQSWPLYLAVVVAVFAVHEGWALATGHQPLTQYVRETTKRHVLLIFLLGAANAWAAMHFWGGGWCG